MWEARWDKISSRTGGLMVPCYGNPFCHSQRKVSVCLAHFPVRRATDRNFESGSGKGKKCIFTSLKICRWKVSAPRAVQRTAKRNTVVCFTSWIGHKGDLSLDSESFSFFILLRWSGLAGPSLALFCHNGHSSFEAKLFTKCRESHSPEGTSPSLLVQFFLDVFFSKVTPGTQTLSATHCIPYKPKPTEDQSGKMTGHYPELNNGDNYYAAINLFNYILTQPVCKWHHTLPFFSFSFSAFFSPENKKRTTLYHFLNIIPASTFPFMETIIPIWKFL